MEAYVSGPLTGVDPDPRPLYERVATVLRRHGIDAYLPHRATDPQLHPDLTPSQVYARDRSHVLSADFVVAFLTPPSLGVGVELGLASGALMPIVAFRRVDAPVSRMALGLPTRLIGPYGFRDASDVEQGVELAVPQVTAALARHDRPDIGGRVRTLRESAGISHEELAERIGTSVTRIHELEEAGPRVSDPTLTVLVAVADALGVHIGALIPAPWDMGPFGLEGLRSSAPEEQLELPFADVGVDAERVTQARAPLGPRPRP